MFNAIVTASLKNRLIVIGAALFLIIYGSLTAGRLPVDVLPDLNRPTVTLMTEAGGMAPEEVEQLVTFPLETAMNGTPGVRRVRSVSGVGLSIVYVEFDWSTDIYRNRQLVGERLSLAAAQLPAGIVPQMGPVTSIMGEIMLIALPIAAPAEPGSDAAGTAVSPMAVREYADWTMRPALLTLPGVAQVIPVGGEVRQYRVAPDSARMRDFGVGVEDLARAIEGFAANSSGGLVDVAGRELLVRNLARSARIEDLRALPVRVRNGQSIRLEQVAGVDFAAAFKRGDGSFNGRPAVVMSVLKQPDADTVELTRRIEAKLPELARAMPSGMAPPRIVFRQASFIEAAIGNVVEALRDGALFVAIVLFLFLLNVRTTLISLTAIPVSILVTALVFKFFGLSINTMTLGGLAIAIGELVDDAVVDIENILRRLRLNRALPQPKSALQVVFEASVEVRSAVVYSTLIIALVFLPLFALPGIEGRLFMPLGIAYVVSILASLVVALTLTPVLGWYLLRREGERTATGAGEHSPLVRTLRAWDTRLLHWSFDRQRLLLGSAVAAVLCAAAALPFFPRTFLPQFNEGTLMVSVILTPGISLAESNRVGTAAEALLREVPEVTHVSRRTGRAELDEHAEGVHVSEIDVDLKPGTRSRAEIFADIRARLAPLPASVALGQPISHRLDHLLSGVRAQIALKLYGEDLDTLRTLAAQARDRLAGIPGIVDLQIEKQVEVPQVRIEIDYARAAQLGISPGEILRTLQTLGEGERVAQVIDGGRRFAVVLRLADEARGPQALAGLLIPTPAGAVPLTTLASVGEALGPNQILRDDTRRRIVVSANADSGDLSAIIGAIREEMARMPLPEGVHYALEGQFQAQEEATQRIALLSLVSLAMIFLILYGRYRSPRLALMIMANVPLALVGAVAALWISGQTLSVAALVGFITLAGIATRNGILKISHYINLCRSEGERFGRAMIVRGSLERLTPVLMTALVAAFALTPLLLSADAPGKEILHPVAVVIFGGLISSTLLDTLLTPVMFLRWGEQPLQKLLAESEGVDAPDAF